MNKNKRLKIDIYGIGLIIVSLFYLIKLLTLRDLLLNNGDNAYLINRASQMLSCIKDGNIPFFYYNDFGGVGYGSSFFYGYLTLYPFLPLLLIGKLQFLYGYIIVSYIINLIGVIELTKRFTKNYKFISLMYICSTLNFVLFFYFNMYVNVMGIGLGFLFLAYTIDFIRDNKKSGFILSGIYYFLVINTHLLTALLCFIITVIVLIYYFDKNRFLDYLKFGLYVCVLCSYFLANFIYHSGSLNDLKSINKFVVSNTNLQNSYGIYEFPFGYFTRYFINNNYGITILDIITFLVLIILFIKYRKKISKKLKILLLVSILLVILSTRFIWSWFNIKIFTLPYQFSFRYMPFVLLFIYIVILGNVTNRDLKLVLSSWSILYLLILSFVINFTSNGTFDALDKYVGNGEYLSKNFTCNSEEFLNLSSTITDTKGNKYKYDINKNILFFNISTKEELDLLVPKLYYKGYVSYLNNKTKLSIKGGHSQFISIKIPKNSKGVVTLYYKHPMWLILLDLVNFLVVLIILVKYIMIKRYKERRE